MAIPYCEAIFEDETYGEQYNLIDRHCYFMGGQTVNSVVFRAYEQLMAQDAPQDLKDLFAVTRKDLTSFTVARRGGRIETIAALTQASDDAKEAEADNISSAWQTAPSGIIIPKTTL